MPWELTPLASAPSHLQVVYIMRVDLTDPDVRLYASPRTAKGDLLDKQNYSAGYYDTAGYKNLEFPARPQPSVGHQRQQFSQRPRHGGFRVAGLRRGGRFSLCG